jgi:uncharacterized phage protein (TIGR01671 family)
MREIKFRITYQHEETGRFATRMITLGEAIPSLGERWNIIGKDQYTGLKDEAGREIYEGDILQVSSMYREKINASVSWERSEGTYTWMNAETWLLHFDNGTKGPLYPYTTPGSYYSVEIIGNIHEHPELLTQEEA